MAYVRRFVAAGVLLVALAEQACGHLPDTSYARIAVGRDELAVKFTYDVTSLIRMLPSLDANQDHALSNDELQSAVPKLTQFLRTRVAFEVDAQSAEFGEPLPVAWPSEAGELIQESDYHAATSLVTFAFKKPLAKPPADVWIRFEFFEQLGLRHTVLGVFEHEAMDHEVLFSGFEPDYFFETLYGEPQQESDSQAKPLDSENSKQGHEGRGNETVWSRLRMFFLFGVEHILVGYDHILFLLSLIVVSRFGELVKIVTAFTVAHSITLALATLRWVELPSTLVETLIAATIVYTAIENFWIQETQGRWKLTFLFGLIHGFGFAGVLRELELPAQGFLRSLLAFNLGVEAGQLVIVALLALPIAWIVNQSWGVWFQRTASAIIAVFGIGWFLDRAFGLTFMPF